MRHLSLPHAQRVVEVAVPGQRVLAVMPAAAAFTNSVHLLDTASAAGRRRRLVAKLLTDDPDPERAAAEFNGLRIARSHGIPVPEPVYLDAAGELLGTPLVVSGFVAGAQQANPTDVERWAEELAHLLARVHAIRPTARQRRSIYAGNELGLYFLSGAWPRKMAGHPLSNRIYRVIRELRPRIRRTEPVFLHMDYWPGNVLWAGDRISALLDWDAAAYGDPALDVGYLRMNLYLRGIREAADLFLDCYEAIAGPVQNLGFWELACAARPLPHPAQWIPASREMGDLTATDDRAATDYYEFVAAAIRRAHAGW